MMIDKQIRTAVLLALLSLSVSACQTTQDVVLSQKSALELRSIQSRVFETSDERKVFRAVISVMQDLGYSMTSVEPEAGVISGNKLAMLDLTATVNKKGDDATAVRANAIVKVNYQTVPHQVDSPEFYQQRFFAPLSQALFLDALYDEDAMPPEGDNTALNTPKTTPESPNSQ